MQTVFDLPCCGKLLVQGVAISCSCLQLSCGQGLVVVVMAAITFFARNSLFIVEIRHLLIML